MAVFYIRGKSSENDFRAILFASTTPLIPAQLSPTPVSRWHVRIHLGDKNFISRPLFVAVRSRSLSLFGLKSLRFRGIQLFSLGFRRGQMRWKRGEVRVKKILSMAHMLKSFPCFFASVATNFFTCFFSNARAMYSSTCEYIILHTYLPWNIFSFQITTKKYRT